MKLKDFNVGDMVEWNPGGGWRPVRVTGTIKDKGRTYVTVECSDGFIGWAMVKHLRPTRPNKAEGHDDKEG